MCLHRYGIVKMKDPRVTFNDNETFLDMVEKYFADVSQKYYAGEKLEDCRPDLCYQSGVTPEKQEKARDHSQLYKNYTKENMP